MCLFKLPLYEKLRLQNWHLKGFSPLCFLKWSRKLHDFLKTWPQPGMRHWKNFLLLCVFGLYIFVIWCHSSGTPWKFFLMVLSFSGNMLKFFCSGTFVGKHSGVWPSVLLESPLVCSEQSSSMKSKHDLLLVSVKTNLQQLSLGFLLMHWRLTSESVPFWFFSAASKNPWSLQILFSALIWFRGATKDSRIAGFGVWLGWPSFDVSMIRICFWVFLFWVGSYCRS